MPYLVHHPIFGYAAADDGPRDGPPRRDARFFRPTATIALPLPFPPSPPPAQFSYVLSVEYKSKGIDVQLQAPFYVSTKMSKIRHASLTVPTPRRVRPCPMPDNSIYSINGLRLQ